MAPDQNYQTCEPFINCTADLTATAVTNTSHCQPPAVQNISKLMLSSTGISQTGANYFVRKDWNDYDPTLLVVVSLSRSSLHHRSDRQYSDPRDVPLPPHLSRQNTQTWSGLQHDPRPHGDSDNSPEYF